MKTKLVIFGLTGDLATRKLLPALRQIVMHWAQDNLEIVGVSRREVDVAELLKTSLGKGADVLADKTSVFTMDISEQSEYVRLKEHIDLKKDEQLLVYLSVPPSAATQIVDFLGETGFANERTKILFEKPFGVDLESARDMIARTSRYFDERQLYRIDHYLAKEMAQNIVVFRGENALFSNIWNRHVIDRIEIVSLEKIDIEGRVGFYEQTGALRDVVQGHLMQLLALTLMDIPEKLDWDELPKLRYRALEKIRPADVEKSFRAQYEGYQNEVENPGSLTETLVSIALESDDPNWQGVPIRLITGKALSEKTTEIRVYLKKTSQAQRNLIVIRIQPNEGVDVQLVVKKPGYGREFETRELGFHFPEDAQLPDAYEQVIVDAIESKKSLFTSGDEVLESWRVLEPLQHAWGMDNHSLRVYERGSTVEEIVKNPENHTIL